jgi:hypothetical protein
MPILEILLEVPLNFLSSSALCWVNGDLRRRMSFPVHVQEVQPVHQLNKAITPIFAAWRNAHFTDGRGSPRTVSLGTCREILHLPDRCDDRDAQSDDFIDLSKEA